MVWSTAFALTGCVADQEVRLSEVNATITSTLLSSLPDEGRAKLEAKLNDGGTLVGFAQGFQAMEDGKPVGNIRAIQCNDRGCRNIEYDADASDLEFPAIAYVAVADLDAAQLGKMIAYPRFGELATVPDGSLAPSPANGVTLSLSSVRMTSSTPFRYWFDTFYDFTSCATCGRSNWGQYEDSRHEDNTGLEWNHNWAIYKTSFVNHKYDHTAMYHTEQDRLSSGAIATQLLDCDRIYWFFSLAICNNSGETVRFNWTDHGWSDTYVYRNTRMSDPTTTIYRYFHTYGGFDYNLSLGFPPSASITIIPTTEQWSTYLPISWSM